MIFGKTSATSNKYVVANGDGTFDFKEAQAQKADLVLVNEEDGTVTVIDFEASENS